MKNFLKKLWTYLHDSKDQGSTQEELRDAYHRDPYDFPKIRQSDALFKEWIYDVIRYDRTVSDIIEYRLRHIPFREYFKNRIPFSQVLLLLHGVIQEYNSTKRAPLETDFLDYLKEFPVNQDELNILLQEASKIHDTINRDLLCKKIENIKNGYTSLTKTVANE